MFAVLVARYDMINGKLTVLLAAVLAGIMISMKNFRASQSRLGERAFDQIGKTYHGRNRERSSGGIYITASVLHHFRLTIENKRQCPSDKADIQRLVALIQNEARKVSHNEILHTFNYSTLKEFYFASIRLLYKKY
jgi:hypothetical protein